MAWAGVATASPILEPEITCQVPRMHRLCARHAAHIENKHSVAFVFGNDVFPSGSSYLCMLLLLVGRISGFLGEGILFNCSMYQSVYSFQLTCELHYMQVVH